MTAVWDTAPFSVIEVDRRFRDRTAFIIRALEAVHTSVKSAKFYETTHHSFTEGCYLHIHRRENLKSHMTTPHLSLKMEVQTVSETLVLLYNGAADCTRDFIARFNF
jgi:hypothetical protein